ncbi:RNA polymerase sigma factor SigA [Acaryochloris thomasi RCC1774]|uniref:RNA polymerase sigma factor SigA n=1 Tax=Acaryochloris thomasi RCC1774 TaxID=1764569 RepID=A0A2W1JHF2_9CYAN|nr:sigma-70 family RNA polymerase sigma factor [Acaryochloris thomasi]PZD70572.1 RNA polymerase sigma factor SigA [Acaryochloris thomasi RCC1774]
MIKSPPLELIRAAQANNRRARDRVFSASYEFVSMIARQWSLRYAYLEFDDCLQAGFEGLLVAIERFDFSKGVQFHTYAKWPVSNSIQELERAEAKQQRTYEKAVTAYSQDSAEPLNWIAEAQNNRSLRKRIYKALKSFSRLVRKWLVLRLLGYSYVKIAERFNVTRHKVTAIIKSAMGVFRQRMFPEAYRFKQTLGAHLKRGQVKRHKPVPPPATPTPIRAVFRRLRTLASGLLGSVQQSAQKFVQQVVPGARVNSLWSLGEDDDSSSSNPADVTSVPGSGIPPPG